MPTPTTANADEHSLWQPCSRQHRWKGGAEQSLCGLCMQPSSEASNHTAGKYKHTRKRQPCETFELITDEVCATILRRQCMCACVRCEHV